MANGPDLHVVDDQTAQAASDAAAAQAARVANNQVSPAVDGMAAMTQTPVPQATSFMNQWTLHSTLAVASGGVVGTFAGGRGNRGMGAAIGASISAGLMNLAGAARPAYPVSMGQRLFMGGAAVALLGLGGWMAFKES